MNSPAASTGLSALIIAQNEAPHIQRCVASLRGWVDQIVVVDAFSTDGTAQIAEREGATVVEHLFEYPAQQKNWAMQHVEWRNEWLLLVDADEYVVPQLRDEILRVVGNDGDGCDGFLMRYRLIFLGRWIRHAGWYPVWILRLVRRRAARFEDRTIDEHVVLAGRTGHLSNDLVHESRRDLAFWIEKHNVYSTRNALEYHRLRRGERGDRLPSRLFGSQAERKRFIKERIWPHTPARGLLFFLYMYVFRLGFLDGMPGLIFCVMHGVFQHMVTIKLWELEHPHADAQAECASPEATHAGR